MSVLRMNAPYRAEDPVHGFSEFAVQKILGRTPHAPITILIHGYRYSPFRNKNNPHRQIFALRPQLDSRTCISWPHHLGFGRKHTDEGLCIAFAWHARGSFWQAYRQANLAAISLAAIISDLRKIAPDRRINIVAHSLGARVLLSSMPLLPKNAIQRVVLMAGAELRAKAQIAMQTPCGKSSEVLNITSRENDLYDLLIELAIAPHNPFTRSLGQGLKHPQKNWLDLQLDCQNTLSSLRQQGYPIAPPARRVCHWSSYLRPGMFPLYKRFLNAPEALPLEALERACPNLQSRRWSRFFARPLLLSAQKR